jgi:hypothetical protein
MDRHHYVDDAALSRCAECSQSPLAPIHQEPTVDIVEMDVLGFAETAAQLGAVANDLGLRVPAFRARAGNDTTAVRTVTDYGSGAVVTVPHLRTRPARETKRDMADGLCEVNRLHHDHPKRWTLLDRMGLT